MSAAEDFLATVPGADMVKFTKNASDATATAVRLARAATGRDHVAVCDQPFFSGQHWSVGTLPIDAGVPAAVRELRLRFRYNDIESLREVLDAHPVACVVMEAATGTASGYLEQVRRPCTERGVVLVFDETITGFRWSQHSAQHVQGVDEAARGAGVEQCFSAIGRPSCLVFRTLEAAGEASQAYRTLFLQEMMLRGVLGQSFVISAAHTDQDVELTVEAARGALPAYRTALEAGTTDGLLLGRPVAPAHRRFAAPREL